MKFRSILKYVSLFAFTFATQLHATYPDQEQYNDIYDNLRQSDHSWAKRFVDIYDQINKGNREDLKNLTDKIEEASDGKDSEKISQYSQYVNATLESGKSLSISLKTLMTDAGKKASDNWPLFTGLNKMIGVGGNTGIYDDAIAWIQQDNSILSNVNYSSVYGNKFPVLKTIGLHSLLALRELNNLSGEDAKDIRSILNIYSPNLIFDDAPSSKILAQHIALSDTSAEGIVTLWKPSATYEFGGNDASHLIWDCSSLEAYITDCPWRFSTLHQEMAWRHQMGEIDLKETGTDISENMLSQFNDKFQAIAEDAELKEMDIIVQRKYKSGNVSCAGHTGFFVGHDPINSNNILLAESNRFDDKSYEGIGIRSVPLYRPAEDGFYWRTFVLRQK